MTSPNDYSGEMSHLEITDAQVEALVSHRPPADPDLAALAAVMGRINVSRLDIDLEDRISHYSQRAAGLARQNLAQRQRSWLASLTPRLAGAALTAVLLLGMTGVALAADNSVPGDFLYGLDRAMERVGLGDGGIQERLDEAHVIVERGRSADALDHVADSISDDWSDAADALHRAALSVGARSEPADNAVGEMLDWMATTDDRGREFGQGVAERARDLAGKSEDSGAAPETVPDGSPGSQGADASDNANPNPGGGGSNANPNRGGNEPPAGPPGGSPPGQQGK